MSQNSAKHMNEVTKRDTVNVCKKRKKNEKKCKTYEASINVTNECQTAKILQNKFADYPKP